MLLNTICHQMPRASELNWEICPDPQSDAKSTKWAPAPFMSHEAHRQLGARPWQLLSPAIHPESEHIQAARDSQR